MATQPAFKSYFAARDELDATLDDGKLTLTGPQNAILRYLIEHAVFDKRANDWGWVTADAAAVEIIARRTGLNESTVRRALAELAGKGLISRHHQPKLSGGRRPDRIRMECLFEAEDDTPEDVAPNGAESPFPEPGTEPAHEPGTEPASFLYMKELLEQPVAEGTSGKTKQGVSSAGSRAETPLERARRHHQENEQLHTEYADRFHDGSLARARRHAYSETDGRDGSIYRFMREALHQAAEPIKV
jgi:DNA-binding MarR family transcriptional regulator